MIVCAAPGEPSRLCRAAVRGFSAAVGAVLLQPNGLLVIQSIIESMGLTQDIEVRPRQMRETVLTSLFTRASRIKGFIFCFAALQVVRPRLAVDS